MALLFYGFVAIVLGALWWFFVRKRNKVHDKTPLEAEYDYIVSKPPTKQQQQQ